MGIQFEEFQKNRDIYIDYNYEEYCFRYEASSKKFYAKKYGMAKEREIESTSDLLREGILAGEECSRSRYDETKSPSM